MFDTAKRPQFHKITVEFDVDFPVKSVQAKSVQPKEGRRGYARMITFLDKDSREIGCFNPQNEKKDD